MTLLWTMLAIMTTIWKGYIINSSNYSPISFSLLMYCIRSVNDPPTPTTRAKDFHETMLGGFLSDFRFGICISAKFLDNTVDISFKCWNKINKKIKKFIKYCSNWSTSQREVKKNFWCYSKNYVRYTPAHFKQKVSYRPMSPFEIWSKTVKAIFEKCMCLSWDYEVLGKDCLAAAATIIDSW